MSLLEIKAVSKAFGGLQALDTCSPSVQDGSITGLIGPNGSGKTTLFNVVTGYERVDQGTVLFQGRSITNMTAKKIFQYGIARTFQELQTDGTISPDEALRLGGEILQQQFIQLTVYHQSTAAEQHNKKQSPHPAPDLRVAIRCARPPLRAHNSLKRNGYMTKTGRILEQDEADLLGIRNIGVKALQEIRERLLTTGCLPTFAKPTPSSEATFS